MPGLKRDQTVPQVSQSPAPFTSKQQQKSTTGSHSHTTTLPEYDYDYGSDDDSQSYSRPRSRSATVTDSAHGQHRRERSATIMPDVVNQQQQQHYQHDHHEHHSHSSDSYSNQQTHGHPDSGFGGDSTHPSSDQDRELERVELNDKIVLCLTSWNGKIGCCYHDPAMRKLFLIEDQIDSSKFDLALNIIDQVNPHLTLVSNRADEGLVEGIKRKLAQAAGDFTPTIEIRANREFQASQGRSYLLDLPAVSGEDGPDGDEDDSTDGGRGDQYRHRGQLPADDDDEVVNIGQEGLRKAYDFMRLRRPRGRARKGQLGRFINSLRLGGSVTLESEKSLETVACLFSYLIRKRNVGGLAGDKQGLDIVSIELISLKKTMLVNTDTLCSLQIFEAEDHANVHSSIKKEGLSVYSMLNDTRTGLGKNLLKRWLLQPSLEADVLNDRYNAVECFSKSENIHISEQIQKIINVKNVPRLLRNLISGNTPVQQWQALSQFLSACVSVRDLIGNLVGGKDVAVLQKLCDSFEVGLFGELYEMIESKVDWPDSKELHRVCIVEGVDERLDDNRRTYNGLPSMLSKIAQHLSKSINPDFCQSLNVIYFPQLGYLCAVPLPEVFPNPRMDRASPASWQFQFSTEISVYYKSQEMRDLDEHVGDLHGFIVDREVELVQEMLEQVLKVQDTLCEVAEVLAEVDVLLAFASAARAMEWTRPVITESNVIRITEGRHPLVERCVDDFVRNDAHVVGGRGVSKARLEEIQNKPDIATLRAAQRAAERLEIINSALQSGVGRQEAETMADEILKRPMKKVAIKNEDGTEVYIEVEDDDIPVEEEEELLSPDDSILVLTGANASGKSVFLKSVAIIVYMAHVGSFVPAQKAVIGLTDKLMTRVSTRESISRGTSSFMIDLQQISLMLRNCTERSLLIIDEFGKGTNSVDGAGLFVGLIKHLVTRGSKLPKTLLATHFHEIFFNEFLKRGLPIGLAHMELIVDREKTAPKQSPNEGKVLGVTPLFKLAPGLCLKSYAFQCAESFGIPSEIVERALQVSSAVTSYNVHEIMDPQMTEDETQELIEAENIVRRLLQVDFQDEYDDEGNYVPVMQKLAMVVGEEYMPEPASIVAVKRR